MFSVRNFLLVKLTLLGLAALVAAAIHYNVFGEHRGLRGSQMKAKKTIK